jgi:poly(A) polymerase
MAICINQERFGELVDPFDGLYDIEDRIIRTPLDPDITFSDDPLRMMRCVRFATQLGFHIEDETFEALGRNKERIRIISQERIITELNKIMLSPTPSRGFVDLHRCGLLEIILPEIAALDLVEVRNNRAHKNNFYHTLEVLDNISKTTDNLYLRWAALLHDVGKPKSKRWEPGIGWTFHNHNFIGMKMIKPIFHRMKLPLDDRLKYVEKLVELHMRPIAIADEIVTDSAVRRLGFEARPTSRTSCCSAKPTSQARTSRRSRDSSTTSNSYDKSLRKFARRTRKAPSNPSSEVKKSWRSSTSNLAVKWEC